MAYNVSGTNKSGVAVHLQGPGSVVNCSSSGDLCFKAYCAGRANLPAPFLCEAKMLAGFDETLCGKAVGKGCPVAFSCVAAATFRHCGHEVVQAVDM